MAALRLLHYSAQVSDPGNVRPADWLALARHTHSSPRLGTLTIVDISLTTRRASLAPGRIPTMGCSPSSSRCVNIYTFPSSVPCSDMILSKSRTFPPPHHITTTHQDETPGLQVFFEGQWVDVPPVPGAFIVNLGPYL